MSSVIQGEKESLKSKAMRVCNNLLIFANTSPNGSIEYRHGGSYISGAFFLRVAQDQERAKEEFAEAQRRFDKLLGHIAEQLKLAVVDQPWFVVNRRASYWTGMKITIPLQRTAEILIFMEENRGTLYQLAIQDSPPGILARPTGHLTFRPTPRVHGADTAYVAPQPVAPLRVRLDRLLEIWRLKP